MQLPPLLLLFKSESFCQKVAPSSPSSDQDANYRDSEEEGHVITTCPHHHLHSLGVQESHASWGTLTCLDPGQQDGAFPSHLCPRTQVHSRLSWGFQRGQRSNMSRGAVGGCTGQGHRGARPLWPPICSNCSECASETPAGFLFPPCSCNALHGFSFLPPFGAGGVEDPDVFRFLFRSCQAASEAGRGTLLCVPSPARSPDCCGATGQEGPLLRCLLFARAASADGHGRAGASVNEPHSSPAAGIWHVIVLGHRGRSDAICWHVLPQCRPSTPLSSKKTTEAERGQPALAQLPRTRTRGQGGAVPSTTVPAEEREGKGVPGFSLISASLCLCVCLSVSIWPSL